MRRTLTTLTLIAALAVLGTAVAGTATALAAPCDVTLTLSRSTAFVDDVVAYRGSVHTASGEAASGTVVIQKRRASGGSWVDWRTARLGADGAFVRRVRMTAERAWVFRARVPAGGVDAPDYSTTHELRVDGPTAAEARVIRLVNAERVKHGLRPVRVRYVLTRAARAHSADMAARCVLTHLSADGDPVGVRLCDYGYRRSGYRVWTVGEDIDCARLGTLSATPAAVVDAWMRSSPHRRVILASAFRDVGVGIRTSATGQRWFTLDMGRRIR